MYKCSECGNEYNTMPKFCDCGNDIFITVEDSEIRKIDDIETDIPQTRTRRNIRKKAFSPAAVATFAFCIIMSLLILFVIGNPKKNNDTVVAKNTQNEKFEIPSIDTFWDNTPTKITTKVQPKEENIIDKIVEQIVTQPAKEEKTDETSTKITTATQKPLVPAIPKKTQVSSNTKVIQPQRQVASKPAVKTQPQNKTQTQAKPQTKTTQQPITFGDLTNKIKNQYYSNQTGNTSQNTKTSTTQSTSPTNNAGQTTTKQSSPVAQTQITTKTTANQNQVQTTQKTNSVVTPVIPTKSASQLKHELAVYKSGLRNTIGKKIDFTRVIGDGECYLTFKLDSNGRLTSKAFSKQSSNITLNDAAFYALNTTTSYNPPPEGYKGETLKLYIKFYNGNFEIMLN